MLAGYLQNLIGQPFTNDFPCADIHELIAPDLLHQLIKGTFKDHLVAWVQEYLKITYGAAQANEILDDIDRR
jgi:Plavaka transposase